jgi:hypothetical protein
MLNEWHRQYNRKTDPYPKTAFFFFHVDHFLPFLLATELPPLPTKTIQPPKMSGIPH